MYLPHVHSPCSLNYFSLLSVELSPGFYPLGARAPLGCSQPLWILESRCGALHMVEELCEAQAADGTPIDTEIGRLEHSLRSTLLSSNEVFLCHDHPIWLALVGSPPLTRL